MKSPVFTALAITGGNILGPLAIFGGIGYLLTERYNNRTFVLAGIGLAFIVTNILIFTTANKIIKFRK